MSWAYHTAAELANYTISRDENGARTLRATVTSSNAFRLTQRPLTFVVTLAAGVWRWPIESLQIAGRALTARLGPPE